MKIKIGILAIIFAITGTAQAEQSIQEKSGALETTSDISEVQPASQQAAGNTQAVTPAQTDQAGFEPGRVTRAALTSAVENREPTDNLQNASTEQNQLYFFTELRDMSGQTAKHRWEFDGKVMAEVEFNVKGPRWRVWSSKSFVPGWTGNWKVSVINAAGDVVSEKNFSYETAAATQTEETGINSTPEAAPAAQ